MGDGDEKSRFPEESLVGQELVQPRNEAGDIEPGALDEAVHRLWFDDRQRLKPLAGFSRVSHNDSKSARKAQAVPSGDAASVTVSFYRPFTAARGSAPGMYGRYIVGAIDNSDDIAHPATCCVTCAKARRVVVG